MTNPLTEYFRNKEIYIKLPTKGRWYKHKPKLSDSGEIGIMPMTMQDEMIMLIPDSLYNGETLFSVLKSVAPDIIDPYEVTLPDLDAILVATRAVSTGKEMNVITKCPKCKESTEYSISLTEMLSKIKEINDDIEIEVKQLKLKLKPSTLAATTASSIENLEIAKLRQMIILNEKENYELSRQLIQDSFSRMTAASLATIADQIESITTPDGKIITEIEYIIEWIRHLDKKSVETIKNTAKILNDNNMQKSYDFKCGSEKCGHEFKSDVDINPTFFFTKN
jgi:hypothetical protein